MALLQYNRSKVALLQYNRSKVALLQRNRSKVALLQRNRSKVALLQRNRSKVAVAEALGWTGTADLAQHPLDSLSGGQRQRAWVSMALAQGTDVLLLDEPTTFLDLASIPAPDRRTGRHFRPGSAWTAGRQANRSSIESAVSARSPQASS